MTENQTAQEIADDLTLATNIGLDLMADLAGNYTKFGAAVFKTQKVSLHYTNEVVAQGNTFEDATLDLVVTEGAVMLAGTTGLASAGLGLAALAGYQVIDYGFDKIKQYAPLIAVPFVT